MANDLQKRLAGLGACDDALTWIGNRTLSRAWAECERADWMLWIASRLDGRCGWPDLTVVVRAACSCAARSLRYVKSGDHRPRNAIRAARRWARNPSEKNKAAAASAATAAAAAAGSRAATAAATAAGSWAAASAAAEAGSAAEAAEHRAMCKIIRRIIKPGRLPR